MANEITELLKNNPKSKILIVQPSRMGDIIFALPAVTQIKKTYPNVHISWIADERCAEIITENPLIDNLIVFDRRHITLSYLKQMYKKLRSEKFDLSIDFHGLFKSAFIVTNPFSKAILRTNERKKVFPEPYSPITSLKDEPPSAIVSTSFTKDFSSSLLPTCICCKPILGTTPLLKAWIIVSRSFGFIIFIILVYLYILLLHILYRHHLQ